MSCSPLWESWGGSPTVGRLRWQDGGDHETVSRLHADLRTVTGRALPSKEYEAASPVAADREYEAAVAVLRERTRLVFAENVEYGFRRNMLGIRRGALSISMIGVVVSILLLILGPDDLSSRVSRWGANGAISLAMVPFWVWMVRPEWVRRPAEIYADRLIEAIDHTHAGSSAIVSKSGVANDKKGRLCHN